jgi:hypothetical protein
MCHKGIGSYGIAIMAFLEYPPSTGLSIYPAKGKMSRNGFRGYTVTYYFDIPPLYQQRCDSNSDGTHAYGLLWDTV